MGRIILTGISYKGHKIEMEYLLENGEEHAYALCNCGYRTEIHYFRDWAGTRMLQKKWEEHKASIG